MSKFMTAGNFGNLRELDIAEGAFMYDKTLSMLSSIPLTKLSLAGCVCLTDAGFASIAGMKLEKLRIRNANRITDGAFAHLAAMPLKWFGFFDSASEELTNEAFLHLDHLPLEVFELGGCFENITTKCFSCMPNVKLRGLMLYGCSFHGENDLKLLNWERLRAIEIGTTGFNINPVRLSPVLGGLPIEFLSMHTPNKNLFQLDPQRRYTSDQRTVWAIQGTVKRIRVIQGGGVLPVFTPSPWEQGVTAEWEVMQEDRKIEPFVEWAGIFPPE